MHWSIYFIAKSSVCGHSLVFKTNIAAAYTNHIFSERSLQHKLCTQYCKHGQHKGNHWTTKTTTFSMQSLSKAPKPKIKHSPSTSALNLPKLFVPTDPSKYLNTGKSQDKTTPIQVNKGIKRLWLSFGTQLIEIPLRFPNSANKPIILQTIPGLHSNFYH